MQEVKTEEDPPLQQEADETEAVPEDPGFLHRQSARLTVHGVCCYRTNTRKPDGSGGCWSSRSSSLLTLMLLMSPQLYSDYSTAVLTVIVSSDCADQAEELDDPTEPILHLKHKHTRQDLKHKHTHIREESGGGGAWKRVTLTDKTLLEMMTATL